MKNFRCIQLGLLAFLLSTMACASNPKHFEVFSYEQRCESDSDCALFQAGCCGCSQGGKAVGINRRFISEAQKRVRQTCSDVFCMQVISQDESCSATRAACVKGQCEVEPLGTKKQ